MSEDFMEGLFTHEFTREEYVEIIDHCTAQLKRLREKFTEKDLHELLKPLREALCPSLEYERDETSRIMEEDYD